LKWRVAEIADLVDVANLDPAGVAHDLAPFHRGATQLVRTHDKRSDAAASEVEIHVQKKLAGRDLVPSRRD